MARSRSKSTDEVAAAVTQSSIVPGGQSNVWPRPVYDAAWVEGDGSAWRMRGRASDAKKARKLMRRSDVRVVLAYGMDVVEVRGAEREDLLARVEEFLEGNEPAHSSFELGDFRDPDHRVTLMIQESC